MSYQSIVQLFQEGKLIQYKKGEILLRPVDSPSGVYLLEKGYVKVYSITQEGNENNQITHKSGELFPLLWAVSGKQKSLYYEAVDDVTVRRISKEQFGEALQNDQQFAHEIIRQLAEYFDVYEDRLANVELNKAYKRVIGRLLFLAKRFGMNDGNEVRILLPLSQKDLANSINMTRETASHEIGKLEKKGLILFKRFMITITDINKLRNELQESQ